MIFTHDRNGKQLGHGAEVKPIKRKLAWGEKLTLVAKYEDVVERAEELGWTVDQSSLCYQGLRMNRIRNGVETMIWNAGAFWQCADLIDGYFKNHRPMNYINDLIEEEK